MTKRKRSEDMTKLAVDVLDSLLKLSDAELFAKFDSHHEDDIGRLVANSGRSEGSVEFVAAFEDQCLIEPKTLISSDTHIVFGSANYRSLNATQVTNAHLFSSDYSKLFNVILDQVPSFHLTDGQLAVLRGGMDQDELLETIHSSIRLLTKIEANNEAPLIDVDDPCLKAA